MEYAATIVAPSIQEAMDVLYWLGWVSSEIDDMGDGTFEALVAIDEASEAEIEGAGEMSYTLGEVTVTISLP